MNNFEDIKVGSYLYFPNSVEDFRFFCGKVKDINVKKDGYRCDGIILNYFMHKNFHNYFMPYTLLVFYATKKNLIIR